MRNADVIWPDSGWAEIAGGDLVGAAHTLQLDIQEGDELRFVLDKSMTEDDGVLAWMPTIQYLEPAPQFGGAVIRILCGSEKEYTDSSGNTWSADTCFKGGRAVLSNKPVSGAYPSLEDTELYAHGRQGKDFTYRIPVPDGIYTVRLKFAETEKEWSFERPFDLYVNGARELHNYDIAQASRGVNKAFERLVSYVVPDAEGNIVLRLTGGWEPLQTTKEALLKAIEILPQMKPEVYLNCGGESFVDWNNSVWAKDAASGEPLSSNGEVILATPTLYDYPLYQTARVGKEITYTFDMPAGLYNVRMKFAEMWLEQAGERPMDIEVNGRVFYSSFDPLQAAGGKNRSIDIRAEDVTPNSHGQITVTIRAKGAQPAMLQAIALE